MYINLTDRQKEHLRQVRQKQIAQWRDGHPHELFRKQEVVQLMGSMGNAVYLDLEGRVYISNYHDYIELPELQEDPRIVASCIVRWSGVIGLPELIDALPPMPDNGVLCPYCNGSRIDPEQPPEDDGFRFDCMACYGLGWTKLDWARA